MMEKWKQIKDFENYEVSNLGNIRSWNCNNIFKKRKSPIIKSQILNNSGYFYVILYKKNKGTHKYVHRIVLESFIKNSDNKTEVNHIDGNKLNNNLNNLEWSSSSENKQHAIKLGLFHPELIDTKGSKNGRAKLTEEKVLYIKRFLNEDILTQKQIGILFNISSSSIWHIFNNKTWVNCKL